ncbi:hypothetical protein JZ751_015327, partial [Albula glossodonta]
QARKDQYQADDTQSTLRLGRKPGDTDLVVMQKQDPVIKALYQHVSDPANQPVKDPGKSEAAQAARLFQIGEEDDRFSSVSKIRRRQALHLVKPETQPQDTEETSTRSTEQYCTIHGQDMPLMTVDAYMNEGIPKPLFMTPVERETVLQECHDDCGHRSKRSEFRGVQDSYSYSDRTAFRRKWHSYSGRTGRSSCSMTTEQAASDTGKRKCVLDCASENGKEILSAITEQQPGGVLATIDRAMPTMEGFESLCPPKKEHSWLTDEVVNARVMQLEEERL